MDFIQKYRLGIEWDDDTQSELFIHDKKADIRAPLKVVTVPKDLIRTHHIQPRHISMLSRAKSNEEVAFEVACMKELNEVVTKKAGPEENLKIHDEQY